jgi:hypothetical protein
LVRIDRLHQPPGDGRGAPAAIDLNLSMRRPEEADAMSLSQHLVRKLDRCRFLQRAGILGGMAATSPAWAGTYIDLDLPGGPGSARADTSLARCRDPGHAPMPKKRTGAYID